MDDERNKGLLGAGRRRRLYLKCRESNDTDRWLCYKRHCKILAEVIRLAKKL
jgi:hypothetical protein